MVAVALAGYGLSGLGDGHDTTAGGTSDGATDGATPGSPAPPPTAPANCARTRACPSSTAS
ncbi:hypothetical protein NKH77_22805 [Streptomyces sp. M19]